MEYKLGDLRCKIDICKIAWEVSSSGIFYQISYLKDEKKMFDKWKVIFNILFAQLIAAPALLASFSQTRF